MSWMQKERFSKFFKAAIWTVLISFTIETFGFTSTAYAQTYLQSLPVPGTMVNLSASYAPILMKGIKTYPDNPFRFDFFIDPGQEGKDNQSVSKESAKLIKYFLASLTVPEEQLWVNLSPYEGDRIMPAGFGVTEMGRDLLAQDYLLKQISASLLDPSSPSGEKFWKKIYAKIQELGGKMDSFDTFNKVWITPATADVYTKDGNAFVVESHLKVLLEEDYLSMQQTAAASATPIKRSQFSPVVREVIVAALEKEVNEGENFAMLRQVYNSMILATWFKRHLRESVFGRMYVGQNKVGGVDVADHDIKEKIYQQYLEAFKKGVFDFIKEDYDPATDETTPRKYFAGGVDLTQFGKAGSAVYNELGANPVSLRKVNLRPAQFLGKPFYRVSSVVVSKDGVNWYNSLNVGVPQQIAASAVSSPISMSAPIAQLAAKFSPKKMWYGITGSLLPLMFLFSSLSMSTDVQAAQFRNDDGRGVIVKIDKTTDTLGHIVQTLKEQKKFNSDILSAKLWGQGQAVATVAKAMLAEQMNTSMGSNSRLVIGQEYLIPANVLAGAQSVPVQIPMQYVEITTTKLPPTPAAAAYSAPGDSFSDGPLSQGVAQTAAANEPATENRSAPASLDTKPLSAILSEGVRLPISVALMSPEESEGTEYVGPVAEAVSDQAGMVMPEIPSSTMLTVQGMVLTSLMMLWQKSLMLRAATARVVNFPTPQRPAPSRTGTAPVAPVSPTPPVETAKVPEPEVVPLEETQLVAMLSAQIRSMSLGYLRATQQIKAQAQQVSQRLAQDFRDKLTQTQLWSPEKVDVAVRTFAQGVAAGIENTGEELLDRASLEERITAQATAMAARWVFNQQSIDADAELDAFIETQINAAVTERLSGFTQRIQAAMVDSELILYAENMNAEIVSHAQTTDSAKPLDPVINNTLSEISKDFSAAMGMPVVLQNTARVSPLHPQTVTELSVRSLILEQSLELQTADAILNREAKNFAAEIGKGLVEAIKPLKLSTKVQQPDIADAVRQYFVPALSRYWLTALHQRYGAMQVEETLNSFIAGLVKTYSGEPLSGFEVQAKITAFINGNLRETVNANIATAVSSFEQEFLTPDLLLSYQDAIHVAVQDERATSNGSGVKVVAAVQNAIRELTDDLEKHQSLVAMPFFTRAMSIVVAERAAEAGEALASPNVDQPETRAGPAQLETKAAPVSFASVDLAILGMTTIGMIVSGNTDFGSALTALASPFMFRAGLTSSLWLHEMSHMMAGGRKAWTKANALGNLSISEWIEMLKPLTGKVAARAYVSLPNLKGKPVKMWANRLAGVGASLGVLFGMGTIFSDMWNMGMHKEVFSALPLLLGSLGVFVGSIKTDIIKPLKGEAKECESECGVVASVSERTEDGILDAEAQEDFKAMGRVTDIRGQQAGGVVSQALDRQGNPILIGDRIVNAKRGDLPETLDAKITTQKVIAKAKLYKGPADYNVLLGHYRYGTSSAPEEKETHPHQWMPERKVNVWSVDPEGKVLIVERNLEIFIVHNGDFDNWKFYGKYESNEDLAFWLERVLHTRNNTGGDSPKIAGMMDYLVTKGMVDASVRFAYYESVATSFDDVFDGKFEKVIVGQTGEIPVYGVTSKNTALTNEKIAEISEQLGKVLKLEAQKLLKPGDDMSVLWDQRVKFVGALADTGLHGIDIVQNWDKQTRLRFAETFLHAFLFNDEYEAAKIFIDRADGSFGLGITSTLKPGGLIFVADGQPLAIGLDREGKKLFVTSEPSALKIKMRDEKWMEDRLTLRQDLGHGEIVNISGSGRDKIKIYSRDEGREWTAEEIEDRLVPLRNNHFISELPNMDSDDPVGDEIRETAAVMSNIKTDWADSDSLNRETSHKILRQIVQKKIEEQIRGFSEGYGAMESRISKKANAVAMHMRGQLANSLKDKLAPTTKWEEVLDLERGAALFSPFLEGALSEVVDFEMIEALVRDQAKGLSEFFLAGHISAEDVRIRATRFAQDILDTEIGYELNVAAERVQASVDSWHKVIEADLIRQTRRVMARKDAEEMKAAGRIPFERIAAKWRESGVKPGVTLPSRGLDVFLMGLEISQWIGAEQFANDLKLVFPGLRIGSDSSNKVLKDPYALGIDDNTIVIAVSQSGQTFPTLNAAIMLERLSPGRLFAVTGEWDTLLGQAVGQEFKPDSPFGGRIISNLTGFRPSEAVSLTGTATQATMSELLMRLSEDMMTIYPNEDPFKMTMTPEWLQKLKDKRDTTIADVGRVIGVDEEGKEITTTENIALRKQSKKWGLHVLDDPFSQLISEVHLFSTLTFGFTVTGLGVGLLPLAIAAPMAPFVGLLTYAWYKAFPYTAQVILRKATGREPLARTGKRTLVIGDRAYVHQSLEALGSKLNSLSKKATAIDIHGANPDDHMIARFGHRVVRGTLIWLGVVDERMGEEFADGKSAITMTGQQAKGVRNYGVGAEVIGVGRKRGFNKNATDVDITIEGDAEKVPTQLGMLMENRYDSLTRLVAGQYFLYRTMRFVSTLDLAPKWRRLWPWAWDIDRTQSGPRIATTRSSQKARNYTKFVRVKKVELPLGLHETHDDDDNYFSAAGRRPLRNVQSSSSAAVAQNAPATKASSTLTEAPGGIDLNPRNLKMNVHGEESLPLPIPTAPAFVLDPNMINALPSDHFVPMIIEVVPVPTAEMFLGMAETNSHMATQLH